MKWLVSTNPAKNYQIIGKVPVSSSQEIKEKVALANHKNFFWKELGLLKRIALLKPIYHEFKKRSKEIAELISTEIGKPICQSRAEVTDALHDFQWFMKNAPAALKDGITRQKHSETHKIIYEPLGTAAVITPWNFPFALAIWGIVPNLICGNPIIFKISEECPFVGKLIEKIMLNHDLPKGVFAEVYGAGDVGQELAKSPLSLIYFTGSSRTGELLYKIAADQFIKAVLEMGGSSPGILFADYPVSKAIPIIYNSRFDNCGQVCDALKRLIVQDSIFDSTVQQLTNFIASKKPGDPLQSSTDLGSLVSQKQLILLQEQVDDAVQKGAKIITGGKIPQNVSGAFYEPTILINITREMRVWSEEVFGPVLPVRTFKTEQEAVELANDTVYGLGARIFSKDLVRAQKIASQIESGTVEINQGNRWFQGNPFGGYKKSGMGRVHGQAGFRELTQIKVISIL